MIERWAAHHRDSVWAQGTKGLSSLGMGVSDDLFPHQAELPPLPLPSLEDTCNRYLDSAKPVLTEEEYAHTAALVRDFCREGGEGQALQVALEEKASEERNWMEEWWEQLAYLRTRTTMAVHINWFGVTPEIGRPTTNVQAAQCMGRGLRSAAAASQY